jgi:DnaK suppressor protein
VAATTAKPAARSAKVPAAKAAEHAHNAASAPSRPALAVKPSAPAAPRAAANELRSTRVTRALALPDADEADSLEPGSLLAGPRNVQPYVLKRGEQYMSKEQLTHFQHILLSWKRDLMEEVDRTVSHMKDEAANFPDPNDRATQEEEFSLELRTRDRERKLIRKIDEALKRIEDGTYGYCLETGEEIGIKRLEARPVATLSIEAQERRERVQKLYGD